ncbi:hypothetical protein HII31_12244 [Pseudocercospora fuligena]|uniref:Uncharacterized protein n=1 Tax=Pseudocercospora fuligena TaxID=685502 RepID=A0A8H6VBS6_9PEZI|nr:hypothetical protein HII31_12244 [Pseudocercospora fuligena]
MIVACIGNAGAHDHWAAGGNVMISLSGSIARRLCINLLQTPKRHELHERKEGWMTPALSQILKHFSRLRRPTRHAPSSCHVLDKTLLKVSAYPI